MKYARKVQKIKNMLNYLMIIEICKIMSQLRYFLKSLGMRDIETFNRHWEPLATAD